MTSQGRGVKVFVTIERSMKMEGGGSKLCDVINGRPLSTIKVSKPESSTYFLILNFLFLLFTLSLVQHLIFISHFILIKPDVVKYWHYLNYLNNRKRLDGFFSTINFSFFSDLIFFLIPICYQFWCHRLKYKKFETGVKVVKKI